MNNQQLIEYLKMVLDIEQTIYIRNTLIEQLNSEIKMLSIPIRPQKPVEPILYLEEVIPGKHINLNERNKMLQRNRNARTKYNQEVTAYNRKIVRYDEDLQNYNRQEKIYKYNKDYLTSQIKILETANNKSSKILNYFYDKGILYSKYRNLLAASKILEYIESGRCLTLEGPEGAYNKLETEYRTDEMLSNQKETIVALNNINNSINRLNNSVNFVGKMIEEGNRISSQLYDSVTDSLQEITRNQINMINTIESSNNTLKKINSNLDLVQFNMKSTKKEAEYLRRMEDLEKGRWFNP